MADDVTTCPAAEVDGSKIYQIDKIWFISSVPDKITDGLQFDDHDNLYLSPDLRLGHNMI